MHVNQKSVRKVHVHKKRACEIDITPDKFNSDSNIYVHVNPGLAICGSRAPFAVHVHHKQPERRPSLPRRPPRQADSTKCAAVKESEEGLEATLSKPTEGLVPLGLRL